MYIIPVEPQTGRRSWREKPPGPSGAAGGTMATGVDACTMNARPKSTRGVQPAGILVVDDIYVQFEDAGRPAGGGRLHVSLMRAARRIPRDHRSVGLRQVHAVQRGSADYLDFYRQATSWWRAKLRARAAPLDRDGVPGGIHLPVAHRDRECRLPAGDRRHRPRSLGWRRRKSSISLVGLTGFENRLSQRTLRWHAAARCDCTHPGVGAKNTSDG